MFAVAGGPSFAGRPLTWSLLFARQPEPDLEFTEEELEQTTNVRSSSSIKPPKKSGGRPLLWLLMLLLVGVGAYVAMEPEVVTDLLGPLLGESPMPKQPPIAARPAPPVPKPSAPAGQPDTMSPAAGAPSVPAPQAGTPSVPCDRSEIAIRMLSRSEDPIDEAFWRNRLSQAITYRADLGIESTDTTAYRLVHGEGDLLPSLIVDRYGDYLVLQALSQGIDRLQPLIVEQLVALAEPRGILARNDPRVRLLEGLEQEVTLLHGEVPPRVTVREAGIEYEIDLWRGQKTGLFLDQRENRLAARAWARGRLLDCFSYHGGFAMALASRCDSVLALDISEEAVASIRSNAVRNHVANLEARAANVFDELRELDRAGERFDTIVLDPPAFAKNKAAIAKAASGYKEINLRAMKLLSAGGILVTCSCSYNVDEELFGGIVQQAAADARADMVLVEKRMQGRDHPVLLGVPETYYLKCFILRKLQ